MVFCCHISHEYYYSKHPRGQEGIKSLNILTNFTQIIMENTVNDYFVNILDMGNEAAEASMIYLSVPNLPSKYLVIMIAFQICL